MVIQPPISIKSFNNRGKLKSIFLDNIDSYIVKTMSTFTDDIYELDATPITKRVGI
jgi:hypothetical protein